MAVKIFGSCSGSSGGKYNIWLEATENSHSISNNTSNLTLKLKLKRNDGYNASAYNLNESENFTNITINGRVKTSKNLEIDTRNGVTVTLISWTGNVTHNADGTLKLTLGGSFTMSGTLLSGGSVSGAFTCITIPRASAFALDKTSVNPEINVVATISPASKTFTHKLTYQIGNYTHTISLNSGVTITSFNIPLEWLNAIPKAKQGTVKVTLKTYNSSILIGSTIKYLKLVVPNTEDFLPEFYINISYKTNDVVPGIWSAIVQNKSTAEVSLTNVKCKYGAEVSSSYITLGSCKKNGLLNEFDLPDSGYITVKARVADTRGFYKDEVMYFKVDEYHNPTVICSNIYRCDSSGLAQNDGTCVAIEFINDYSAVRGLNLGVVTARYKKSTETEYSDAITLKKSPFVIQGDFQESSSYDFILSITDQVTKTPFEVKRSLSSVNIPFNIKKGGNGAAIGCYAENENELTVGYDLNVKGELKYESLNSETVAEQGAEFVFLEIRKYACLRLISINAKVKILVSLPANTIGSIFQIQGLTLSHTYPVPIHLDFHTASSGELAAYVNVNGIVKIHNQEGFSVGDTVNINAVIDY